jgi:hypothetical protein
MKTIDQCLQTFAGCINSAPSSGTSGYAIEGQMFGGIIDGHKEWSLIMILLALAVALLIIVKKM